MRERDMHEPKLGLPDSLGCCTRGPRQQVMAHLFGLKRVEEKPTMKACLLGANTKETLAQAPFNVFRDIGWFPERCLRCEDDVIGKKRCLHPSVIRRFVDKARLIRGQVDTPRIVNEATY